MENWVHCPEGIVAHFHTLGENRICRSDDWWNQRREFTQSLVSNCCCNWAYNSRLFVSLHLFSMCCMGGWPLLTHPVLPRLYHRSEHGNSRDIFAVNQGTLSKSKPLPKSTGWRLIPYFYGALWVCVAMSLEWSRTRRCGRSNLSPKETRYACN